MDRLIYLGDDGVLHLLAEQEVVMGRTELHFTVVGRETPKKPQHPEKEPDPNEEPEQEEPTPEKAPEDEPAAHRS